MTIPGRIIYDNRIRGRDPSVYNANWWSDVGRLTDEDPVSEAKATGYAGVDYYLVYDLGSAKSCSGWGFINHNLYTRGYALAALFTGSTDNGTTFDQTRGYITSIQSHPEYQPSVCQAFGAATKRYWRILFSNSIDTSALLIGQIMLGQSVDLDVAPADPFGIGCEDRAIVESSLGGMESRRSASPAFWRFGLSYPLNEGGEDHVRDTLHAAWIAQGGPLSPVMYVDHRRVRTDATYDVYPCSYCVIEELREAQRLSVAGAYRYDVQATLRELTFDGVL